MFLQAVSTSPPFWLELLRSPAMVIFSLTICTKFLLAPALATYTRKELQSELQQLAKFPLFVQRLELTEQAVSVLPEMSKQLTRIEGQLESFNAESR